MSIWALYDRIEQLERRVPVIDHFHVDDALIQESISFRSIAEMPAPRHALKAAVIDDIIYAVGGTDARKNEAYNPQTDTWSTKANVPGTRTGYMVASAAGSLYAIGGYESSAVSNKCEAYSPATNTWSAKTSQSTTQYLGAAGSAEDKIYVVGGNNNNAACTVYSPTTNAWSAKANMSAGRSELLVIPSGRTLYAMGGMISGSSTKLNEAYDIAANKWSTKEPALLSGDRVAAGVIRDIIYVTTGLTLVAYNTLTDTWSTLGQKPSANRTGLAGAVVGGELYSLGGEISGQGSTGICEVYSPVTPISFCSKNDIVYSSKEVYCGDQTIPPRIETEILAGGPLCSSKGLFGYIRR